MNKPIFSFFFVLICAFPLRLVCPVSSLGSEEAKINKFVEREATDEALGYPNLDEDALLNTQCPQHLELRWKTEVSSSIYATPLIADINSDGKLDIVVPSFVHYLEVLEGSDGEKMAGWPAYHQSTVHATPLLYDWRYKMSDRLVVPRLKVKKDWYVGLNPDPVDRSHPDVHDESLIQEALLNSVPQANGSTFGVNISNLTSAEYQAHVVNSSNLEKGNETNTTLEFDNKLQQSVDNSSSDSGSPRERVKENGISSGRRLLEDDSSKVPVKGSDSRANSHDNVQVATVQNDEPLEADADASFELFRDDEVRGNDYNYDYVGETMWGDEEWKEAHRERLDNYVNIDSHILCTPVIADIDNDGVLEMVIVVSYFFDHEYYDNPEHLKEVGGIDIRKYIASGIVVFNLDTKQVKWRHQLDLSTDTGKFRAYIYSSPTVVDLDGDRNLDTLVGTSYGMFYVLDHRGKVRENFPLEMAEIQGTVVAADINDDGKIELVTADIHGNVVAWTPQGKQIWEKHIKSLVPQGPSIGDVDGDDHTDVFVPTISGNIYVLSGIDGSLVRPYPYRTHGKDMNQVLLVDLNKRGADVVDIGETSYSMVLADNVDGGDDLDLIVTTMNGNVFCFSTPAPHHPLKAWRSPYQGRNNIANRIYREGIYVTHPSRAFRDFAMKKTSLLVPGNYQGERTIKQNQIFKGPGKYSFKLPTVTVRTTGTVLVEMIDKNGLYFSDEFSLTFHMHYYKLLKWLIVLPMVGMLGILVILRPQEGRPLPSFSRNTNL